MTWGNNSLHFVYDALGASAVIYNGTAYYYLRNAQGDIVGIVDSTGTQVVAYSYDVWGKLLTTTGTMATTLGQDNPLRYRGYVYDTETGLYYLTSRYYNPSWGRFINADGYVSTGQGFVGNNMFAYCNNNPVMFIDPDGRISLSSFISSLVVTYEATKALLSLAGDIFLRISGRAATRATYEHGMWGYGADLPQKKKDTIIKQLKESPTMKSIIDTAIADSNGKTLKASKSVTFGTDEKDLYYAIHNAEYEIVGYKSGNSWNINVTLSDPYNFDTWWDTTNHSFGGAAANNLGLVMQRIGMMVPYQIKVSYDVTR